MKRVQRSGWPGAENSQRSLNGFETSRVRLLTGAIFLFYFSLFRVFEFRVAVYLFVPVLFGLIYLIFSPHFMLVHMSLPSSLCRQANSGEQGGSEAE